MKKTIVILSILLIAVLMTSLVLYAGDEKSTKKEATKCPMSDKKAACTDKTAKSECAGMDASKSKDDKCAKACADKKAGTECKHDSLECKDKMAKGECKHDSKECKDKMAKGECKHDSKECKEKCSAECKHDEMKKK